jgi:pimeloyl-ACP methyl ester carboxylesterase
LWDSPGPNSRRFWRKNRCGTDKLILVRQSKIHYVEAGQGNPVILIPGSAGTYRVWNRLMPLMAGNYRLLALDYQPADATAQDQFRALQEYSDLIAQMVRQLDIGKVHLIGAGSGGTVAFDLAARYPELVSKIVSILGYLTLLRAAGKNPPPSVSLEDELKAIKAPILYLYGTRTNERVISLKRNLELLQKSHPRAWIVSLAGGIFETALKNPAEVANLILDFLKAKG